MALVKKNEALLITNPTNIRYLTGFVGVDRRDAYLLVLKNKAVLFTNSLYREQARKLTAVNYPIGTLLGTKGQLEIVEVSRENPISRKLAQVLAKNLQAPFKGQTFKGIRLGYEEQDLTVAEFEKLKSTLKDAVFVPAQGRVEKLRMIKRQDEIAYIRQAAKLTDECFDFILGKIRPGVTEGELAGEIESFFRKSGADAAFSPIVAFGKNTSQPHYSSKLSFKAPQSLALKLDDIILLDFGARVNGYCADMTRMVFVRQPKHEWKLAYQTVLEAQKAALSYLQAQGRALNSQLSGSYADRTAREVIRESGLPPYPHSLGHGVGLDIHEKPRLTIKKPFGKLKAGMVFSVEPGIYIEGRYGIRIEDLVLLKKDGLEILSQSKKTLTIL